MNVSDLRTKDLIELLTKYINMNNIWIQTVIYMILLIVLYPIEKVAIPYIASTCIVKWQKGDDPNVLFNACMWFFLFFCIMTIIWAVLYYLSLNVQQHIGVDVREAMVKELFERYQTQQKTIALGAMTTHLNNVPTILEQLYYKTVCYILPESIGLLVVACYFTYVNIWLGIGSFIFLFMCIVYFSFFIHKSQRFAKNEYQQQTHFHQNAHNIVDNLAYIQTSQSDDYEFKRFGKQCDTFYATRSRFCVQNTAFIFGFHVLKILYIAFVIYLLYRCMVYNKTSVRQIVLYGSVFVILLSEEKDIDYVFKLTTELYNYTSQASVMLDDQQDTSITTEIASPNMTHVAKSKTPKTLLEQPFKNNALSTQSLVFSHSQTSKPILHNKTVHFQNHQLHAIVGPSGCGKTTFATLVAGIHNTPTSGNIYIYGKDYTYDAPSRREMIIYLPQHIKLFEGSLLDNIRYTHEKMTHASVDKILQTFEVADILRGKYKSSTYLHRLVGVDGSNISGGQKQIIILMRTYIDTVIMAKNNSSVQKSIIILDEPTASLDDHMVSVVMKILQTFKTTHTIIMITHNQHIAKQCDSITVF